MNVDYDITLRCNFSCLNCNRHSNFNSLVDLNNTSSKVGVNLYDNTNVSIEQVKKFIEEVKVHTGIDRLHLVGGEPFTHPHIDKIADLVREELYGKYIPNIMICSNMHPTLLKSNTLDTPEEIIRYFPFGEVYKKINLENIWWLARAMMNFIQEYMETEKKSKEEFITELDTLEVGMEMNGEFQKYRVKEVLSNTKVFHGIPLVNYNPLDLKAEQHRCTMAAPYDTGQEMLKECNIPIHCGVNHSFDGYWPCNVGAAIARLFKLEQYRKEHLPKSYTEWEGITAEGHSIINKNSKMWDLCKLCQLSAKVQLKEKEFGRPISVSYRKALGLELNNETLSKYVVPSHQKNLASIVDFKKEKM